MRSSSCLRIVEGVQPGKGRRNLLFKILHSLAVDRAVKRGVARGALFHKFGKQTGGIQILPRLRDLVEDPVAHAAALPVRDHLLCVCRNIIFCRPVAGHGSVVEDAKIFHRMAGQLGKCGNGFGQRSAFADDKFIAADIDRFFAA